ncbi:MAG: hypothetical protein ACRDWS_09930 [Acidimicrobiia bacterium]
MSLCRDGADADEGDRDPGEPEPEGDRAGSGQPDAHQPGDEQPTKDDPRPDGDDRRRCKRCVASHDGGAEQLPPAGLFLLAGVTHHGENRHQGDEEGAKGPGAPRGEATDAGGEERPEQCGQGGAGGNRGRQGLSATWR